MGRAKTSLQNLGQKVNGVRPEGKFIADVLQDMADDYLSGRNASLQPSGTDTSTNILAFTEDKGIWIGTDTGNWYYWNGTQYVSGGVYQAVQYMQVNNITSPYDDFNTMPNNLVISFTTNITNVLNKPIDKQGTLLTYGGSNNTRCQIYTTINNEVFFRRIWGSTWTSWKQINNNLTLDNIDNTFYNSIIKSTYNVQSANNIPTNYDDFNTIPNNTMCVYTIDVVANISNIPNFNDSATHQGTLLTYGMQNNVRSQLYCDINGDLWHRRIWGSTWTSWYKINNYSNDLSSSIAIFEKIAVVGDSYASGEIYVGGVQYDKYSLSWIQIMARRNGITAQNYSKGGMTTTEWLTSNYGLNKMLSNDPDNLYILALGLNDRNYTTLGSISDINDSDPTLNPNTFYGNYGKIIEAIKTHAPNCKLIMSTMAKNNDTNYINFNNAIVEIANHYNIPIIYQYNDYYFQSTNYLNGMVNYHPTSVGYGEMAKALERLINECISNNRSYFNDYLGND